MKRVVETEVMSEADQAKAYAEADFEAAHSSYPLIFAEKFPHRHYSGWALDLGCGPCDVTIRFAQSIPALRFIAVDGSAAMLRYARRAVAAANLSRRIKLIEGFIPGARIPRRKFDVILSSSFLHHLHAPEVLWQTVRRYAKPGTMVFVPDLRRPATCAQARALVRRYSAGEPKVLRRDFYNSLRAAFTPAEVRRQLRAANLEGLQVQSISDRHLLVHGILK